MTALRPAVTAATTLAAMMLATLVLTPSTVRAGDPATACQAGKLTRSGVYASCRLKAEAKAVKKGSVVDYGKCETKFATKFGAVEAKAGAGVCPSENDTVSINERIAADAAAIATLLAGGAVAECGNGVVEPGEDCDVGDLAGATCATTGMFGSGLACGPACAFDTGACAATRYENTGLTVIDHETGLEWQRTDDAAGLTDKDNTYTWTGNGLGGTAPNGTAFTEFLAGLNAPDGAGATTGSGPTDTGCFAGHCDWRLPVIEELVTIVDCSFGNPCIDQSLFGPTNASSSHRSSSTKTGSTAMAWSLNLATGSPAAGFKNLSGGVRAVRGGL